MLSRSLFGNNDNDKCRVISQVTMVTKASILHIDIVRDLLSFEFKFIVIHYFVFPKCIYKTTFSEKSFSTMHSYLQCVLPNGSGQIEIFLAQ